MLNENVNVVKRNSLKNTLIKLGLFVAGLIGLSSFVSAQSIFYRSTSGTLTNLNNGVQKTGDTMTGDLIGTDFVSTRAGTVNRTSTLITSVVKTGGRTLTISRSSGLISTVADGSRTWTLTRNGDGTIASWSVA